MTPEPARRNTDTTSANLTRMHAADERKAELLRARGWTTIAPADRPEKRCVCPPEALPAPAPSGNVTEAVVETASLDEEPTVPKRVTAGLTWRVRAELQALMGFLKLGLTDVVNRGVSAYYLIVTHDRAGYELVFRHRENGAERTIMF